MTWELLALLKSAALLPASHVHPLWPDRPGLTCPLLSHVGSLLSTTMATGLLHPQTSSQLHKPFLASQVPQASLLFLPPKLLEAPGALSPPTGPSFCTTCPFSWALLPGPPMVSPRGEIQQPFLPQAPPAWSRGLVCSVSAPPDHPSLLPQPDLSSPSYGSGSCSLEAIPGELLHGYSSFMRIFFLMHCFNFDSLKTNQKKEAPVD